MKHQPRPIHCTSCSKKFRPNRAPAALFPGTVMHAGRGLCGNCHRDERISKQADDLAMQNAQRPQQIDTHRELETLRFGDLIIQRARYEADRARRGIPTDGLSIVRNVLTRRPVIFLQEAS